MFVGILNKGDHVISVTQEFVAVERMNGEVDVLPIIKDRGLLRVDADNIVTIGYGDNVIETKAGDVTVTTF